MKTNHSGYIGILSILIGTAIMLFLFTKMYFTPVKNTASPTAVPVTQYDNMRAGINAANQISNQQKIKALEADKLLNSVQ